MYDSEARAEELARLMPQLCRVARRLTPGREAAEDLAQEALLRVWARLVDGGEIVELRPYLFSALRNLGRRPGRVEEMLTDDNEPRVPPAAGRRIALREVLAQVAALPPEQGDLIRALAVEGVSYSELARRHRLPLGTVMSRVSRGRARLLRALDLPPVGPVTALLEAEGPA